MSIFLKGENSGNKALPERFSLPEFHIDLICSVVGIEPQALKHSNHVFHHWICVPPKPYWFKKKYYSAAIVFPCSSSQSSSVAENKTKQTCRRHFGRSPSWALWWLPDLSVNSGNPHSRVCCSALQLTRLLVQGIQSFGEGHTGSRVAQLGSLVFTQNPSSWLFQLWVLKWLINSKYNPPTHTHTQIKLKLRFFFFFF